MSADSELRKKRGTIRRSLTNVAKRLTDLEGMDDKLEACRRAQRLSSRVTELDGEFKAVQYRIISAIDEANADTVAYEQEALDKHDEEIDTLSVRIQTLIEAEPHKGHADEERSVSRNLSSIKRSLSAVTTGLSSLSSDEDDDVLPLIQQYREELSDLKAELVECRNRLSRLDLPDDHELSVQYFQLKGSHFEACHSVKKMLSSSSTTPPSGAETTRGLKVPKLEAPMNWTHFWEQFSISIDQKTSLTNAEKLVYLQQSLKGGAAQSVIQGLSATGEHYGKAIECLKARYDRPRLIHQSHVKAIMEMTPLKEGGGKELRRLHDVLQQHLRALDAG